MRTTTLLLCVAAALLVSSDASSSNMLPVMRIGLALGSSFLRRLAEMKEGIREDLDRQAPLWAHLMHQHHPFGQVPWPMIRLQGTLIHGGQGFVMPESQVPQVPPFAVIRPCRPGGFVPCLSTLPSSDSFPQGVGYQAGHPFALPTLQSSRPGFVIPPVTTFPAAQPSQLGSVIPPATTFPAAQPSQPDFVIPPATVLPAVTLPADLQDKTGATTTGVDETTVATTPKAAVALLADLQDTTGSTAMGADQGTVATMPMTAVTLLVNLEDKTGATATGTDATTGATATGTDATTDATATGTDETTLGTTVQTASTTVTIANTGSSLDDFTDIGTRAAFTAESSATEQETTQVTPTTTQLTSHFPTAVGTKSTPPSTVSAEPTSHGTIPTYFVGDNYLLEERHPPPVFAKMLENEVSS